MKLSHKLYLPLFVLLVVIITAIGYYYLSNNTSIQKQEQVVEKDMPASDLSSINCPYIVDDSFPKEYFSNLFGEVTISYPPVLIEPMPEVAVVNEEFNPSQPPAGEKFYTIPEGSYPWQERSFDVDNDGKDERIFSANTAMNHTPHLAKIVKNDRVIFNAKGANILVDEAYDHNGFFLSETLDWNTGTYKNTRYIHKEGKFIPVWYQLSCAVEPKSR